jgi:hypothetical protein
MRGVQAWVQTVPERFPAASSVRDIVERISITGPPETTDPE